MFEVRVKAADIPNCKWVRFDELDKAMEYALIAAEYNGIADISIYDGIGCLIMFYDFETDVLVPTVLYI